MINYERIYRYALLGLAFAAAIRAPSVIEKLFVFVFLMVGLHAAARSTGGRL